VKQLTKNILIVGLLVAISSLVSQCMASQNGCVLIDKSRSAQIISYEKGSDTDPEITLRLYNNTSCSIVVETNDHYPTRLVKHPNKGVKIEVVTTSQDGIKIPLHYLVQDTRRWRAPEPGYSWGDSVFNYEILAGQSVLFTVPLSHFKKRFDVIVPFRFKWERIGDISTVLGDVNHLVYFLAMDLPETVLRRAPRKEPKEPG
jgi:hypothetical protein